MKYKTTAILFLFSTHPVPEKGEQPLAKITAMIEAV
jgi:hypothetical protein